MTMSKKQQMVLAALVVSVILTTVWFAFAEDFFARPEADLGIAADLAALSGLSQDTVLKIYDKVQDWETVRENIFVYKKILELVPAGSEEYHQAFEAFGTYKATDVLTVYEFLDSKGYPLIQAETMLADYAAGINMDTVLANASDQKTYLNYKAADKEQIRQWLGDGYLPEDIMKADEIARAKDMKTSVLLAEKTGEVTWQQIAAKYDYQFETEPAVTVSLSVYEGGRGKRIYKGKNYQEAAAQILQDARTRKERTVTDLREQTSLSKETIAAYEEQGFNVHEINNAFRLSRKSGTDMGKILKEKQEGKTWERIIAEYSGKKPSDQGRMKANDQSD